jgi:hypothetical protein
MGLFPFAGFIGITKHCHRTRMAMEAPDPWRGVPWRNGNGHIQTGSATDLLSQFPHLRSHSLTLRTRARRALRSSDSSNGIRPGAARRTRHRTSAPGREGSGPTAERGPPTTLHLLAG